MIENGKKKEKERIEMEEVEMGKRKEAMQSRFRKVKEDRDSLSDLFWGFSPA